MGTFDVNSRQIEKLDKACLILDTLCTNGYKFTVKDVYYDYGAGIMWTTIIADNDERCSHYQMLSPKEHTMITESPDFEAAIKYIMDNSNKNYDLAKFNIWEGSYANLGNYGI